MTWPAYRERYIWTITFPLKKSNIFPFFEGKKEREGGGAASIGMLAHRGCPSHLAIVCLPIYICHLWWSSHQSSCLEPLFCGSLRLKLSPLLRFPQSSEYIVSPGTVLWDVTSYSAGLDFWKKIAIEFLYVTLMFFASLSNWISFLSCNKLESTCHKGPSVFQFSNISDFFVEYMSEVHNCPPPDPSQRWILFSNIISLDVYNKISSGYYPWTSSSNFQRFLSWSLQQEAN